MYFILHDKLGKNCNKIETWDENKMLLISFLNEFQDLYFCLHIRWLSLAFMLKQGQLSLVKMRQKFGHTLNCGLVPIIAKQSPNKS